MDMIPGSSYEFYKKSSVHGIKWTGSVEIISRVFNFIITLVLARLLTPQDFGQIALALVGIKFVQLVIDFGVSSAIVQKPQITREHYDTSFTIIILFSIFISLFFTFASNLIAEVLGNSNIASLIKYLSVVIILGGFNIIPRALLIRELKFKKIAIAELLSVLFYGFITIFTAFILRNVWCFIFGLIAEQVSLMISLWWFSRFKPRVGVNLSCLKDLYYFSSVVFGTGIMNFFNLNIFQILINKFYGSVSLGLFSLAFNIIDLPTQRIAKNVMKVMYPILSKLHQNSHDYEKMFINYMVMIVLIISPFYIMLYELSKPFVLIFYGVKWSGVISLIKILCMVGFLRSLWTGISVATMSLGRPQFELYLKTIFAALLFPGIFILHRYGLELVLLTYTGLLLLVFMFGLGKILNWLGVSFRKTIAILRLPVISNLILFIFIFLITHFIMRDHSQFGFAKLVLVSASSLLLYLLILYIMDKQFYQNLMRQLIR